VYTSSGGGVREEPLSGGWPAIGTTAGDNRINFPFFWMVNDTLKYMSFPSAGTSNQRLPVGEVKDSSSQFPGKVGDPVAAKNRDGCIEVFWVSNNDSRELRHIVFNVDSSGTNLSPVGSPTSLGGGGKWSPNRRPAVAQNAANELELFMVGLDDQLYNKSQKPPSNLGKSTVEWPDNLGKSTVEWPDEWVPLAGSGRLCFGDPVVARNADGRLEVFVLCSEKRIHDRDNKLVLGHFYQYYVDNNVKKWSRLFLCGPSPREWSPRAKPAVALNPDGLLEVFMVGLDGILYHTWQTEKNVKTPVAPFGDSANWDIGWQLNTMSDSYSKWPPSSNPSITRTQDGRIELFMQHSDGRYYHQWQTSKNNSGAWDWSGWEVMPEQMR